VLFVLYVAVVVVVVGGGGDGGGGGGGCGGGAGGGCGIVYLLACVYIYEKHYTPPPKNQLFWERNHSSMYIT